MLKIDNITYTVENKQILKNLSLEVQSQTIHSILGPNGTGKTTLGFVLMGLTGYQFKSGRIIFDGEDITRLSITERAQMGLTLAWQHSTSFEGISVRDYLSIAARKSGFDFSEALSRLGLEPEKYLSRNYDTSLSGGERKRIELAAIMAMKPRLAILDEPDSGIDTLSMGNISSVIKEINKNGSAILLITHNWKIARIADVSSTLCDGTIIKTGDPQEVADFFIEQCQECTHINYPQLEKTAVVEE